jgi:hypothetical protein
LAINSWCFFVLLNLIEKSIDHQTGKFRKVQESSGVYIDKFWNCPLLIVDHANFQSTVYTQIAEVLMPSGIENPKLIAKVH